MNIGPIPAAPAIQTLTADVTDPNRISGVRVEVQRDFIRYLSVPSVVKNPVSKVRLLRAVGIKSVGFRCHARLGLLVAALLLVAAGAGHAQDRAPAESSASGDFLATLTPQERAWLREHPVITVALDPSWAPIEFTDKRGTPSGMTTDYLRLIEARLGMRFERVPGLTWQEAYARMQRWEIDLATTVAVTAATNSHPPTTGEQT